MNDLAVRIVKQAIGDNDGNALHHHRNAVGIFADSSATRRRNSTVRILAPMARVPAPQLVRQC